MLLPQPQVTSQPLNQKVQDFDLKSGKIKNNNTALALVIQNTERAEKFIMARLWMSEWRIAKSLYEAPVRQQYWRDTLVPRSSNSFPLVAQHVRAILDQAMPAIFPDVTPFAIQPNEGTPRQMSRAWESIISWQLRQANVKTQMRLVVKDAEVFGTGIGKWGWETYTRPRTMYRRKVQPNKQESLIPGGDPIYLHTKESDELEEFEVDERISQPYFKRVEINHVLVSPGLREPDIRQAEYVIHRDYLTIRDLNRLRDYEGYNIPSEEELKQLVMPPAEEPITSSVENEGSAYPTQAHRALPRYIDESEDPLDHKLEVLEYWTNQIVVTVVQRKLVIRNEGNPFGMLPFVSCFWDDIPNTFYAFGIPRRIGGVQTHIQGLRNLRLDDIHINLQNMWLARKGTNITAQPIRAYPGAVFKVDDMEDFQPIKKQPVLQEAYKEEEVLIDDAEKTSGANEMLVQGAMSGGIKSTGMRSGTGAGIIGGASSSRVQSFVDTVCDQCLTPLLYSFLKMNRMWLDPAVMRKVVGKTLWQALERGYDGDLLIDMCNNEDIQFTMLAGSNIAAKQKMAQSLPLLMQMLMTPAAQQGLAQAGMKTNWLELARRMEESTGWKSQDDLIIPMTPEDQQRQQAMNPAVINAQATRARLTQLHQQNLEKGQQDHQHNMEEIDAKGLAGAGESIITRSIERGMEREETPGLAAGFEALGG